MSSHSKKTADRSRSPHNERRPLIARRISDPGLLLGVHDRAGGRPFGFVAPKAQDSARGGKLVRTKTPTHAVTIAGTGAGKGRDVIIPNVLMHDGPLICFDAGEITRVCARRRREMGDQVHIVDPFAIVQEETASFNPVDVVGACPGYHPEDTAEQLAWEIARSHPSNDAFWTHTGASILAGCIASAIGSTNPDDRTLVKAASMLEGEDPAYRLAVGLDTKQITGDFARGRVTEFLELPDGNNGATRSCVLATARQYVKFMQSERVRRCLGPSSFDLSEVVAGDKPISIFFVFPPIRSRSHGGLLKLWLSTLSSLLCARVTMPAKRTLVIIDECAQAGRIEQLPTLYSYLRGTGTSIWTFWQSLSQMSDLYATDWRVLVENAGVIQAFGLHATAVEAIRQLLSVAPSVMASLDDEHLLVTRPGAAPEVLGRLNYRRHRLFDGLADPNPRYARVDRA